MSFLHYTLLFGIISVVAAQYVNPRQRNAQVQAPPARTLQIPEYIAQSQNPVMVAYTLQLPSADSPSTPFYTPELVAELQRPQVQPNQNVPLYYDYPEPSVELQAPSEGSWNPNNDPNLYYGNLPVVIDLETPTNSYPKKFNKDIHEKKYSGEPKKEIILKPVTSDELAQLQKTVDKYAKADNQKQIRSEKTEQAV